MNARLVWLSILGGVTIGLAAFAFLHPVQFRGYDFQAFWCGGATVAHHADPYLNEPIHTCEASHSPAFFTRYPNVTIPAPLPPYALALFAPLSLIPFAIARGIWWIVLVAAALLIARATSRLSGMPYASALAACGLAVLGPALVQGALAPVPIALIASAALALRASRWNLSAILLGLSMIEPHMALPAAVAVFLTIPAMRLRLLFAAVAAAALAIVTVGPSVCIEYFTRLLPVHALGEVNNLGQDSLTTVLYHLGMPAQLAVHLGGLQYGAISLCGIAIAIVLMRREKDRAWLALVPASFAVIGGEFIHLSEVAMAVPLACVLAARRPHAVTFAMVLGLAVPSESVINWALLSTPAALAAGWLMSRRGLGSRATIAIGAAMIGLAFYAHGFAVATAGAQHLHQIPQVAHDALSSITWSQFNALSVLPKVWWPEKLLTFVPLLLLFGFTLAEATPPKAKRRSHFGTVSFPRRTFERVQA